MKPEEAISVIETISKIQDENFISEIMGTWYKEITADFHDALTVAVDALKKQIPMKPILCDDEDLICPTCDADVDWKYYCEKCGQKIDWSENE